MPEVIFLDLQYYVTSLSSNSQILCLLSVSIVLLISCNLIDFSPRFSTADIFHLEKVQFTTSCSRDAMNVQRH